MKGQTIKDLLKIYKRELDFIDFDDHFELMNLFSVRGQLIERYSEFTTSQLNIFDKLEVQFVGFADNLVKFKNKIMEQNSRLYMRLRKVALTPITDFWYIFTPFWHLFDKNKPIYLMF